MRSLTGRCFFCQDYAAAARHWELALEINALHARGWFDLGYARMKLGRDEEALQAFSRATQIQPDLAQAWNNVAALHMKRRAWPAAFAALAEAVKFVRNSWQMWDNYAECAVRTGQFQQAVRGLRQVLDLTGGAATPRFDPRVVLVMVQYLQRAQDGGGGDAAPREVDARDGAAEAEGDDDDDVLDLGAGDLGIGEGWEEEEAEGEEAPPALGVDSVVVSAEAGRLEPGSHEWAATLRALQGLLKVSDCVRRRRGSPPPPPCRTKAARRVRGA